MKISLLLLWISLSLVCMEKNDLFAQMQHLMISNPEAQQKIVEMISELQDKANEYAEKTCSPDYVNEICKKHSWDALSLEEERCITLAAERFDGQVIKAMCASPLFRSVNSRVIDRMFNATIQLEKHDAILPLLLYVHQNKSVQLPDYTCALCLNKNARNLSYWGQISPYAFSPFASNGVYPFTRRNNPPEIWDDYQEVAQAAQVMYYHGYNKKDLCDKDGGPCPAIVSKLPQMLAGYLQYLCKRCYGMSLPSEIALTIAHMRYGNEIKAENLKVDEKYFNAWAKKKSS